MPPLEGDEKNEKRRKNTKNLTRKKVLTRLPILIAEIKSGNNSYKVKHKTKQIIYLLYQRTL